MTEVSKTVSDFWSAQGKAMLAAQQGVAKQMDVGMQAMFGGAMTVPANTPPELAQAAEAMMQLWSVAAGLSTELAGWLGEAIGDRAAAKDAFGRITDPRQWVFGAADTDEALARMAEGPRLADLFDVERRYTGIMRRWSELRLRTFEHQRVVLDAWMMAGQHYLAELAGLSGAEGRALEPKQALALWTEIGNRHMVEAQRSDAFLKSQRAMIRASTELRVAQGELSEFIGKQYGLPTRTELDDVHRSLTEMRRELRRVRRELDAAKQAKQAELPPPALPAKSPSSVTRPATSRREAR